MPPWGCVQPAAGASYTGGVGARRKDETFGLRVNPLDLGRQLTIRLYDSKKERGSGPVLGNVLPLLEALCFIEPKLM